MPEHNIPAEYGPERRILILGSFPSVRSREEGFFYAHPRNRFWKVIASVAGKNIPRDIPEKKKLLSECGIALWDVIASCGIEGSSDASIRDAAPNDIGMILGSCPIKAVFTNGRKAHELYARLILPSCGIKDICLPSTSAANAAYSLESLTASWSVIGKYLKE
ncbi:MAG: DNA-deoxyinosine glycosylase [Eubacteriaceae bacterium]|nr:DNA-deoxyinosine glycosylase [Eubacteriaceae bacterium]